MKFVVCLVAYVAIVATFASNIQAEEKKECFAWDKALQEHISKCEECKKNNTQQGRIYACYYEYEYGDYNRTWSSEEEGSTRPQEESTFRPEQETTDTSTKIFTMSPKEEEEMFERYTNYTMVEFMGPFTGDDATKAAIENDLKECVRKLLKGSSEELEHRKPCYETVLEKHCKEADEKLKVWKKSPGLEKCEF